MNDYLLDRVTSAVGTQFLVDREIGRGGMAVVYRATDLRLNRPVAIKVLPPDLAFNADVRTRFIREAQTAAQLSHPNIVSIYAVEDSGTGNGGGLVYFVMGFVDGESLGVRLAREGAWPIDRTVRVLRDIADALAYAHARGVVHRDIKPDNILIDRASGRPMVTDFGIARAAAGEVRLTVTGVAVGTPAYMSPEQALGERELDGRSDLYSLGVVGYHMLAGAPPFKAANTPAILLKHVSERPRPIRDLRPDVPSYLAVAIDRALAKKPEDRWADAGEFRDALDGAIAAAHQPVLAPRPPSPAVPARAGGPSTPVLQPFPAPPTGLNRRELREWYRAQRRVAISQQIGSAPAGFVVNQRVIPFTRYDDRPLDDRVIGFRRSVIAWMGWTAGLFTVNVATHGPGPWFVIPSGFLFIGVLRKLGSIWSDGVGPIDAFRKGIRTKLRAQPAGGEPASRSPNAAPIGSATLAKTPEQLAAELAPADVLRGPHGEAVRRAAQDRGMMLGIIQALRPVERELVPDIRPTLDALAERVGTLATTLHRLDADVSGASLGALDERIASLQNEMATAERDRRLSLLQRQRTSLRDLLERRRSLLNQMESAGLMLQNLKLDLLKLRSSGLGSVIEDSTSATQEARALSREIGLLVEASEEIKKL